MGRLTRRLVTSHSRVHFHTTCISYSEDDKSLERTDVRTLCEEFVDLHAMNALTITDVQEVIVGLDLDIIIDITSHTYEGRIGMARAFYFELNINPSFLIIYVAIAKISPQLILMGQNRVA